MATNGRAGDNRRHGAIKDRTQLQNLRTKLWIKRDDTGRKFKGVRTEK